jgi:hypothetical protein
MAMVTLEDQEWQQVLALLSDAPWRVANPLLMKIGQQLQAQRAMQSKQPTEVGITPDGNGKEARHE